MQELPVTLVMVPSSARVTVTVQPRGQRMQVSFLVSMLCLLERHDDLLKVRPGEQVIALERDVFHLAWD
jgi:hypothetical protein